MKPSLKIALAQWNIQDGNSEFNLNNLTRFVKEAKQQNADLLLIPEMWYIGYDYKNFGKFATDFSGGAFLKLSQIAQKNQIAICGTSVRKENDCFYNTMTLYDSSGQLICFYDKIYLFGPMGEADNFSAGKKAVVGEWEGWKIGFGICYDLRFPELFRNQLKQEMQLILLSAQWPSARIAHWNLLLKARAVENQAFMVGCNRVGATAEYEFPGSSAVISPKGEILTHSNDQEGLWIATIEQQEIFDYRKSLHFLYDIRNDIY